MFVVQLLRLQVSRLISPRESILIIRTTFVGIGEPTAGLATAFLLRKNCLQF